jgi:hypothetical protein
MRDSEWCLNHDPDRAEENKRRSSKGGKRGGRGRPQVELTNIKTQLQDLADSVLAGETERSSAAVVSQILNVYLRAVSVELQVKEQLELLGRLEALEEASGDGKKAKQGNLGGSKWGA